MEKIFLYVIIASIICCNYSCNKEDTSKDINYPTTIYRLPKGTLLQMRNDFAQRNPNVYTTLNQFGFCSIGEYSGVAGSPDGFTKEEAIAAVKEFVARNLEYTGVNSPDDLHFRTIHSSIGYNNVVSWSFRTENQIINNIEVKDTELLFNTLTKTLVSCQGNHFPKVYVPEKFNFDAERAKSKLLGKEAVHWGWAGQYSLGIVKEEHLQECPTNLIIVPITTEDKIELHVAWQIRVDAVYYVYTVDVMTGKIIGESPTIIS